MGNYTYGTLGVNFSRKLTNDEYETWRERATTTAPPYRCGNSKHGGAWLNGDGRCPHYDDTPGASGFCYRPWDAYDPEGWTFDDSTYGDVGIGHLDPGGFEIEAGGKVYDIEQAAAWWVHLLPADVEADGEGLFETEGEHWGVLVRGREVRNVEARVSSDGWDKGATIQIETADG